MNKKDTWNQLYSESNTLFGDKVNPLAIQIEEFLPAHAKVLNLGDGEAFNSVFFAQKKHIVTSLDSAEEAQKKASQNATDKHVSIEFICCDIFDWQTPSKVYDLVSLFFVHVESNKKTKLASLIWQALKPGGLFLFECFHEENLSVSNIGPKSKEMLYTEDELQSLYPEFEIKYLSRNYAENYREGIGKQAGCTLQFIGLKKANADQ